MKWKHCCTYTCHLILFLKILFVFQLILNEKGFLSQRRTMILHQGEGPIKNIKWKGSLIAWSNELVRYC